MKNRERGFGHYKAENARKTREILKRRGVEPSTRQGGRGSVGLSAKFFELATWFYGKTTTGTIAVGRLGGEIIREITFISFDSEGEVRGRIERERERERKTKKKEKKKRRSADIQNANTIPKKTNEGYHKKISLKA